MEKKVDRRVIKTRRQLKKGLAALMKEKSVNQKKWISIVPHFTFILKTFRTF